MKEQQWITDRLPTTTDSVCGLVMVPSERVEGWAQKTFASIELGDPWAPWPKMPPFEPEPEYWSRPSDIPANALWFLAHDGECGMLHIVTIWGIILDSDFRIAWKELSDWRWSDRPFDRFEDGKPCTKKCSGEN